MIEHSYIYDSTLKRNKYTSVIYRGRVPERREGNGREGKEGKTEGNGRTEDRPKKERKTGNGMNGREEREKTWNGMNGRERKEEKKTVLIMFNNANCFRS